MQVKVEETEEHNQQLLQENQELKARCARLEEQSSAAQAELRQKQVRPHCPQRSSVACPPGVLV